MSSKLEKEKYEDVLDYSILREDPLNLKLAILSYTHFSKSEKFIYDGHERMPFLERHPIYQSVLRNEFPELIRKKYRRRFSTHLIF